MDKETLSHYGWIVVLILILSVMIALATPFGQFIADGFKATYIGFGNVNDNALGIFGQTISGPPELKYYQPYVGTTSWGSFEFVFHEDGAMDIYRYDNEMGKQGIIYDPGFVTYEEEKLNAGGHIFVLNKNGTLTNDSWYGREITLTLVPTPIKPLQMNIEYIFEWKMPYANSYDEAGLTFQSNGSGTYTEYDDGEVTNSYDIPTGELKYFDEHFEDHYYDAYDGETYIDRWANHPSGNKIIFNGFVFEIACPHLHTEIRNASDVYTGDKYCSDCEKLLEKGTPIGILALTPGLYQSGSNYTVLLKDWDTLLNEHIINVSNGVLTSNYDYYTDYAPSAAALSGDLLLPSDGTVHTIGNYGLAGCTNLKQVMLGTTIKTISDSAFYMSSNLEYVGYQEGIESIGYGAFMYCRSLNNVVLPSTLVDLKSHAYAFCDSLYSLSMSSPSSVYHSNQNCIINTNKKAITQGCNGSIIPEDGTVTSTDEDAFRGCTFVEIGLQGGTNMLKIPSVIKTIGYGTFAECGNLITVTIPNTVTHMDQFVFSNCTKLKNVTLSENAPSIGTCAFADCTSLEAITIPDNVTEILGSAFVRCRKLQTVNISTNSKLTKIEGAFTQTVLTSFFVPKNVSIIDECFKNKEIVSITVDTNNPTFCDVDGILYTKDMKTLLTYPASHSGTTFAIPNSVTKIREYAFINSQFLVSATIPASVSEIGTSAFSDCYKLQTVTIENGTQLEKIPSYMFDGSASFKNFVIPKTVTEIGARAFYNTSIASITIPASVKKIETNAFGNLNGKLTSVTFEDTNGWWYASSSTATSGKTLSSSDLSSKSTAATYITKTYAYYNWFNN